ncbi:unnamed protein product, partial [Nippostrongylus brasiliensis]|uniref:Uncharacterized protein n=1 Tax=Nippostrongylus brasiliensis TaxID=27835 RepID=A0A0N4XGV1_NIPBR
MNNSSGVTLDPHFSIVNISPHTHVYFFFALLHTYDAVRIQSATCPEGRMKQLSPAPARRRDSCLQEVSADFLRLNGSRQQFRNLLSTRKKLVNRTPHHGPVITVEDTGSQLRIS